MHFCIITIHNASSPAIKTLGAREEVHVSQRERKTKEPVRERKTVGASARGRPWEPVRERKTMGASEQEKEPWEPVSERRPWEPVSERKTIGASEQVKDHGSQ
jgi:hypothetical protein